MRSIIEAMRELIGVPQFYKQMGSQMNYTWDYGAMIEYVVACLILLVVIGSVFKIITRLFK